MPHLTWKCRTHNPEVAGSNPARATKELQFTGVVERSAPLSFTRGWVPPIPRLTPDPGGFERHAHSDSVIRRCSSHVSTGPLFFGAGNPIAGYRKSGPITTRNRNRKTRGKAARPPHC